MISKLGVSHPDALFICVFVYMAVPHTLKTRGEYTLEQLRLGDATRCNIYRYDIQVRNAKQILVQFQ